jgi:hypothetical protein
MTTKKTKNKIGRPLTQIDLEQAEKLGMLQCTIKECSAWFGIPPSTLAGHKEFRKAYEKGLENGKQSLRRKQWHLADKSATMAIWLGKQYLGQKEMPDSETSQNVTIILKPKQLAGSDDDQD